MKFTSGLRLCGWLLVRRWEASPGGVPACIGCCKILTNWRIFQPVLPLRSVRLSAHSAFRSRHLLRISACRITSEPIS